MHVYRPTCVVSFLFIFLNKHHHQLTRFKKNITNFDQKKNITNMLFVDKKKTCYLKKNLKDPDRNQLGSIHLVQLHL